MKFDTKIVRAGIESDPTTGAIVPPIYQTATYVLPEVGRDLGFDYTRSANPTRQMLEEQLAAIEGGKYGVCFASGMATVDSCMKLLKAGDHVVCSDDVYGGVSRHFNRILVNYDLHFTYVDSSNPRKVKDAVCPETKMLWVETPTNPLLKVTDLVAMAQIAKEHDLLYGVDSTFATPVFLRPLEFGADMVVHSTTKYLSGHNQLIGGVVITSREDIFEEMKFVQKTIGAVPSPFDCWLTSLGVKTLHLRMERHTANGQIVAEFLEAHPKVASVTYPGLPSHPQHEIAKVQMDGFSGMISFELEGGIAAGKTLMNTVKLCALAESLGAVETMITHPATMTHADVPAEERHARGLTDGLVRISVGIEDPDDIVADLDQALERV
ncbi:MAG: PLP-dependent aspartate aminotransferase family protein [Candidatus Marinimicrobia bacterium]|jgi:cystathionine beta-lyase/cystathionine gamma-synthase|nr:cystathionine gamma-synthase [Candidatus Neomarinimicrobiota bacterium]MDP6457300.1 PLP-dependent aspartate aminotransferase family protein [Candidatus Neomarinimicrobiota bacterium]MDP6592714.1 PLP-dependent aspartate aminotransferase family protein [Candidatus Neomarinimicrobiota bacterium]MDP6835776.1 PLP-dependent aspartate aminotransferase family protein [Candidatus Neomarinimicrobiota bacterium]MDP6967242.1 PLP-dependent aspartate aminotransferase family protein [Candidatus Neomarinimi|tara:strand:- start:4761 stop:5903 length:1143 start_codon:yes stop_codon:yes gene_type:complete